MNSNMNPEKHYVSFNFITYNFSNLVVDDVGVYMAVCKSSGGKRGDQPPSAM